MDATEQNIRVQTVCMVILSAIALGFAFAWLSSVLIPFVLAVFFTYCLTPIIDILMKHLRFPRYVAVTLTILFGSAILIAFATMVSLMVGHATTQVHSYQEEIRTFISETIKALPLEYVGIDQDELNQTIFNNPGRSITAFITNILNSVLNILSNGVLVMIFMIFMLIGSTTGSLPSGGILEEIKQKIQKYLLTMFFISAVTGVLVGSTLEILGVQFSWLFGFLAFMLNFIPNIGSIIATILPLPVAFLSPELSITAKVLVLLIPWAIQFAIGNVMTPMILGGSLQLHPVTVLLSLIFFGTIWGFIGMFLAAPITAIMKICFERMELTKPVAEILSGNLDSLSQT